MSLGFSFYCPGFRNESLSMLPLSSRGTGECHFILSFSLHSPPLTLSFSLFPSLSLYLLSPLSLSLSLPLSLSLCLYFSVSLSLKRRELLQVEAATSVSLRICRMWVRLLNSKEQYPEPTFDSGEFRIGMKSNTRETGIFLCDFLDFIGNSHYPNLDQTGPTCIRAE